MSQSFALLKDHCINAGFLGLFCQNINHARIRQYMYKLHSAQRMCFECLLLLSHVLKLSGYGATYAFLIEDRLCLFSPLLCDHFPYFPVAWGIIAPGHEGPSYTADCLRRENAEVLKWGSK